MDKTTITKIIEQAFNCSIQGTAKYSSEDFLELEDHIINMRPADLHDFMPMVLLNVVHNLGMADDERDRVFDLLISLDVSGEPDPMLPRNDEYSARMIAMERFNSLSPEQACAIARWVDYIDEKYFGAAASRVDRELIQNVKESWKARCKA